MRKPGFVLFCIAVLAVTLAPLGVSAQASNEIEAEIAADRAFAADAPAPVTVWQASPPIGNIDGRATVFFSDFESDNGGGVGTLDWEWGTYAWAGTCSTRCSKAVCNRHHQPRRGSARQESWGVDSLRA